MLFLEKIAEQRIQEAIAEGQFENLEGKGLPLALDDDSQVPPELRMAYKILKMAECLPPEISLKQDIITLRDLVANLPETQEKLQQMRRLNFLVMKLNMSRNVSPLLQEHEEYTPKILAKLERAGVLKP